VDLLYNLLLSICRKESTIYAFLPARRYASAGTSYGPVSDCLSACVCVCLSQVGVLSKRLNKSDCFLSWELLLIYTTLCYKEIQVLSKARVLPWKFAPNCGLRKFPHSISSVKACYNLSSRRSEREKLGCRRSTELIIPRSSDARLL